MLVRWALAATAFSLQDGTGTRTSRGFEIFSRSFSRRHDVAVSRSLERDTHRGCIGCLPATTEAEPWLDLSPRTGDDADLALLERARAGDSDAFGELYAREVDAARRLARILVGEQGAEELVSESFARVLTQLQAGRGPTDDFRAYLHVTIRNGFRDGLRATKESPSSDQPWLLDDVLPPVEELVEDLDREVAVSALATLPKSWQQVLWHLEVEGRKPAEVATILDMELRRCLVAGLPRSRGI